MRPANVSTLVKIGTAPQRHRRRSRTPASRISSSSRGARRFRVQAEHDAGAQAQAGQGQRAEGDTTTEHPASRVLLAQVTRGGSDHHDVRCLHPASLPVRPCPFASSPFVPSPSRRVRGRGARPEKPILGPVTTRDGDAPISYFYELHESDSDLFADVLLAHDTEYDEN